MIFEVVDGKIGVIEEAKNLKEVKALWDYDRTRSKLSYNKYITYIFYVYREDGIYKNLFLATRKRQTCVNQLKIKETEWEQIEAIAEVQGLITWYLQHSLNKEEQLLVALDKDIDDYLQYLKNIKYIKFERIVEKDSDGVENIIRRDIDNSVEKMRAIKNSKDLIIYRNELKKLVKSSGKSKGNRKTFRTRKFEE